MKLSIFLIIVFFSAVAQGQGRNSISSRGNLAKLYAFYSYGKYKKFVEVSSNPTFSYYRKMKADGKFYVGLGVGLRTYSFNEWESQTSIDKYYNFNNINISLKIRREDFIGRRNKVFVEIGSGLNTGIKALVVDYYNVTSKVRTLGTSLELSGYGGYQYVLNNKWKFEIGVLGQNDLYSKMFINNRRLKFVTNTLVTAINFSF